MTRCSTGRCGADDCPTCNPNRGEWVKIGWGLRLWIPMDDYNTEEQYQEAVRRAKEDCDD